MDALVNQRGMTLVEVMVATAILALVMLGVVAVAMHTQRSTVKLVHTSQANWVANNIVAEIRAGLHGKMSQTGSFQGQVKLGDINWFWQAKAHSEDQQVILLTVTVHEAQTKPSIVTRHSALWSPS